jgi:L-ribulose-5-phosphate 3-epimerase
MSCVSRREFLIASGAAAASIPLLGAAKLSGFKVGVMDGVIRQAGKPEALGVARRMGFEGVQVTLGRPASEQERIPLSNPAIQKAYLAESRRHSMPINATYIDVLHVNCLKNDSLAPKWVMEGIDITQALKAKILMTVFFGKCALATREEMDTVAGAFRELAPEARKKGVILAFENTISAEDNLRIFDQVSSPAFKIYYDSGNATNMGGFDAPREIRLLGKERICQFHIKDRGYLGEGKVDHAAVLQAIADIGFSGFANLETNAPSGSWEADTKRNLDYLRQQIAAVRAS